MARSLPFMVTGRSTSLGVQACAQGARRRLVLQPSQSIPRATRLKGAWLLLSGHTVLRISQRRDSPIYR